MKLVFLILVFGLPYTVAALPVDWFQEVWLVIYAPYALVMIPFVYFRPESELLMWVCISPLLFWLLVNAVFVMFAVGESGFDAFGQSLFLSASLSTIIGLKVGVYIILVALVIYLFFRQREWLN